MLLNEKDYIKHKILYCYIYMCRMCVSKKNEQCKLQSQKYRTDNTK